MLVMFNPFDAFSGTEIFAGNLAKSLEKFGCEVHIVCKTDTEANAASRVTEGITMTQYASTDNPYIGILNDYYQRLRISKQLLKNTKFDAILAVGAGQGLIFRDLARTRYCPPLIYYAFDCMKHEGEAILSVLSLKRSPFTRKVRTTAKYFQLALWDRVSCKYSDMVQASSLDTKLSLNNYYGIRLEKIKVTYAGVPNDYTEGFYPVNSSEPTFLHVATDHERKGTIYLLKALNLLKKKYNYTPKVVIVGMKDSTYVNMAKRFEVNASFIETHLSKHRELYASCTALIVPSVSEGFCLPVIEAAMFGKPAIVSDAGSLPELVDDGIDGYVVPVGDVSRLAERIYILATDQGMVKRMSLKAKEKAHRFEINNIAKVTLSLIQAIKGFC